ncbi:MAG: hypothetical protein ACYCYM_09285 [Saccharofermentanales bacterium]
MKKKQKFEDDGRVVAKMNFDDTPWAAPGTGNTPPAGSKDPMTPKQTASAIGGALLAALLIGFAFVIGLLIFLLFAVNVWFR